MMPKFRRLKNKYTMQCAISKKIDVLFYLCMLASFPIFFGGKVCHEGSPHSMSLAHTILSVHAHIEKSENERSTKCESRESVANKKPTNKRAVHWKKHKERRDQQQQQQ